MVEQVCDRSPALMHDGHQRKGMEWGFRDSVEAFFGTERSAGNGSDHRDISRPPSKWKYQMERDYVTLRRLDGYFLEAL